MEHREVGVANATEGKLLISLSKIENLFHEVGLVCPATRYNSLFNFNSYKSKQSSLLFAISI